MPYSLYFVNAREAEDMYASFLERKGIAKTDATNWLRPVRDKHLTVSIRDGMMGRRYDATMTVIGVRLDTHDWTFRYQVAHRRWSPRQKKFAFPQNEGVSVRTLQSYLWSTPYTSGRTFEAYISPPYLGPSLHISGDAATLSWTDADACSWQILTPTVGSHDSIPLKGVLTIYRKQLNEIIARRLKRWYISIVVL